MGPKGARSLLLTVQTEQTGQCLLGRLSEGRVCAGGSASLMCLAVATAWQVSWYADTGKRKCQLLRSFDGADSDVLAAAAMRGASALATACDNGEVRPRTHLAAASVTAHTTARLLTHRFHVASLQLCNQVVRIFMGHEACFWRCSCCRRCTCGTWRVGRSCASCWLKNCRPGRRGSAP